MKSARTYWVVVEIQTGERRVFETAAAAEAFARERGDCEVYPEELRRKGHALVPARTA
jgi:hypothetical protein